MNIMTLNKLKFSESDQDITYEFVEGYIYAIYKEPLVANNNLKSLANSISYLNVPIRGSCNWKGIDIRKFNPSSYRKNMISIIKDITYGFENMSVIKFLKYSTNNFENMNIDDIESIDYLHLIHNFLEEFGFDNIKINSKIRKLSLKEQWKLRLALTVLRGNELLLIDKTIDNYDKKFQLDCFHDLRQMIEKYHLCVIIITENDDIANNSDYLIRV